MPNTLTEKAIAQPFRVGLMLGALILPALWVASEDVLRIVTRYPLLNAQEVTDYFASGALPGMFLGAGAVRAWAAWRTGRLDQARWLLMSHGALVAVAILGWQLPQIWSSAQVGQTFLLGQPISPWLATLTDFRLWKNFPLQVALAMLLLGLFMRGENV